MKNLYKFLSIILFVAACSKQNVEVQGNYDDVMFSSAVGIDSKVSYLEEEELVRLSWVAKDQVGMYSAVSGQKDAANVRYFATESASVSPLCFASPSARIKWKNDTEPHDFYAYYPYSETAGADFTAVDVSVPLVQKQACADDMSHVAKADFMWAVTRNVGKEAGVVPLQFSHLFSVLDIALVTDGKVMIEKIILRVKDKEDAVLAFTGGKYNLDNGELDLSDAETSSSLTVECNFTSGPGAEKHIYAVVNPGLASETIQISIVIKGEEKLLCEKTVPSEGFPAGKFISTTIAYETQAEELVEVKDLSSLETANCYVINKAETSYSFNASVKGNGFVPSELSSVVTSTGLEPKSVLVLWYNTYQKSSTWVDACPIDISSLCISNGQVHFDTPAEFIDGNLVIVAFAEEGVTYDSITVDANGYIDNATVIWSWNIWAVEDMDLDAEAIKVTYTADDNTTTEFTVMDRNLGALVNGKTLDASDSYGFGGAAALGNTYQWGRKDPIPHVADYGNYWPLRYSTKVLMTPTYTPIKALQRTATEGTGAPQKQLFVMDYSKLTSAGAPAIEACLHQFNKSTVNFAQAVNSAASLPYKHFRGAVSQVYDKHWFPNNPESDPWKYLWGDYDVNDGVAIKKTIFDPCPAGWTLWQEETVHAFVQNGAETASIAVNKHGLMVAGSYFGYNGGGRKQDMSFDYATPFVICGYACPVGLTSGTASDRYNHKILRNFVWKSPTNGAGSVISVTSAETDAGVAQGYSVRCIKTN